MDVQSSSLQIIGKTEKKCFIIKNKNCKQIESTQSLYTILTSQGLPLTNAINGRMRIGGEIELPTSYSAYETTVRYCFFGGILWEYNSQPFRFDYKLKLCCRAQQRSCITYYTIHLRAYHLTELSTLITINPSSHLRLLKWTKIEIAVVKPGDLQFKSKSYFKHHPHHTNCTKIKNLYIKK